MFSACGIAVSRLTSQTFSAGSYNWTAPGTTSRIASMTGVGSPGQASYQDPSGWQATSTTTQIRRDGGANSVNSNTAAPVTNGSAKPSNYCDPVQYYCNPNTDTNCTIGSTVYSSSQTCYSYSTYTGASHASTTGASTNAFGKTFPGGNGGAGTNTTFTNVAVTSGSSYPITVPTGGTLTISYYK